MSGVSGASRSTSPHKMLLETSFCGSKSNLSELIHGTATESKDGDDVLEKILLARKLDPTEAIMAEGITMESDQKMKSNLSKKPASKNPEKPARMSKSKMSVPNKSDNQVGLQQVPPKSDVQIPTISIGDASQVRKPGIFSSVYS